MRNDGTKFKIVVPLLGINVFEIEIDSFYCKGYLVEENLVQLYT
jgi:hypothetical protein